MCRSPNLAPTASTRSLSSSAALPQRVWVWMPAMPANRGWSSGKAPLPISVTWTGTCRCSASARSSAAASAMTTPPPARMRGRRAPMSMSIAARTAGAVGCGTSTGSGVSISASYRQVPRCTSIGRSIRTGPGRPDLAILKASLNTQGAWAGSFSWTAHLVTGLAISTMSTAWNASWWSLSRAACPVMQIMGMESARAV